MIIKKQYLHTEVLKILWKSLKDTCMFPNSYTGHNTEAMTSNRLHTAGIAKCSWPMTCSRMEEW